MPRGQAGDEIARIRLQKAGTPAPTFKEIPGAPPIISSDAPAALPAKKKRGEYKKGPIRPKLDGDRLYAPGLPTSGLDLVALWDLPPQAFQGGRIKVSRQKYASLEVELIHETSIEDYSMVELAQQFGPGVYFVQLSADAQQLWKAKNAKISISAQYAATAGYQQYPVQERQEPIMPRISEARALQATAGALDGSRPITVGDLAQLMEMMADKTAQAITRAQPAPAAAPMGIDAMLGLWTALSNMQKDTEERTLKLAQRFMKEPLDGGDDEKEPSWQEGILKALPGILNLFTSRQVQQQTIVSQPVQTVQPVQPNPAPIPEVEQMPKIEVPMTEEEIKRFAGSALMLRPFVEIILKAISTSVNMKVVAMDLEGYIPFKLEAQIVELAQLAKERGPAVLGIISPLLATPQAAEVMQAIAEILTSEEEK